jgi:hypothetical protein
MLLATHNCTRCHGAGRIHGKRDRSLSCSCVFRNIFRACLSQFRQCVQGERGPTAVNLERTSGNLRRSFYGRRFEEFAADFYLVSKRELNDDEFKIFKYHFLYGADFRLCCRQLGLDRGKFFHDVYNIQQRLGRAFRDLKPYALFPLDDYFYNAGGLGLDELRSTIQEAGDEERRPRPVVPPLLRAA